MKIKIDDKAGTKGITTVNNKNVKMGRINAFKDSFKNFELVLFYNITEIR